MSIATITAGQRVEVRDAALTAARAMQRFTQSATTPRADETAEVTPLLEAAAAALVVAGASGLPATSAAVANGATVNVTDQDNNPSTPATVTVAAGAVTGVKLNSSTSAIVQNASGITLADSAGTAYPSGCTAQIVGGVATQMRMVATARSVNNAVKIPVGTVSGSGTFGTFTVVNGVITGIVLSAS